MSFREKTLWVALLSNIAVWGWYFSRVGALGGAGLPESAEPFLLGMIVPVIIAITVIHVAAISVIAILEPREADAPLDERERAIKHRATASAYEILSVGLVLIIGGSLFFWNTYLVVNAILLLFIVAESIRYGMEILALRRGY